MQVHTDRKNNVFDEIHNIKNYMGKVILESSDKILDTMLGTTWHDLELDECLDF